MADGTEMTRAERREAKAAARQQERENRSKPSNTRGNGGKRNNDDNDPVTRWLNVGDWFENPETGEQEFIGLRVGIPVSALEMLNGSSWYQRKKNQVLYKLQNKEMQPGEEIPTKLTAVLREVGEPVAVAEEDDDVDIF